jgi:hypothetical protein
MCLVVSFAESQVALAYIVEDLMILQSLTPIDLGGLEHLESRLEGRLGAECQLSLG